MKNKKNVIIAILIAIIALLCIGLFAYFRMEATPIGLRQSQMLLDVDIEDYVDSVDYITVSKSLGSEDYFEVLYKIKDSEKNNLIAALRGKGIEINTLTLRNNQIISEVERLFNIGNINNVDLARIYVSEGKIAKTREVFVFVKEDKLLIMG